jgi:hypothetical protein
MSGFSLPKGYKPVVTPKYNPQQTNMLKDIMAKLGGGNTLDTLQGIASGDGKFFENMENQGANFLQNKLLPQIQQNFANSGMLGSSAFQGAQTQAASDLASSMQGQRSGLQMNAMNSIASLLQSLLQNPMEEYGIQAEPKKEGLSIGSIISALAGMAKAFI